MSDEELITAEEMRNLWKSMVENTELVKELLDEIKSYDGIKRIDEAVDITDNLTRDLGHATVDIQHVPQPIESELTGVMAEEIISIENNDDLIGADQALFFADGTGRSHEADPVDVSKYKGKIVKVENNHNEDITARLIAFRELDQGTGGGSHRLFFVEDFETIEAYDTKIYSNIDYPTLGLPIMGLAVHVAPLDSETDGSLNVYYLGGTF